MVQNTYRDWCRQWLAENRREYRVEILRWIRKVEESGYHGHNLETLAHRARLTVFAARVALCAMEVRDARQGDRRGTLRSLLRVPRRRR